VFDGGPSGRPSLFAGGRFAWSGGVSADRIAEWDLCVDTPLGDLNGDTIVGLDDVVILLEAWGPCPPSCPPACTGDLNGDCSVDVRDFLLMLAYWT
jgi:hypothetical protein